MCGDGGARSGFDQNTAGNGHFTDAVPDVVLGSPRADKTYDVCMFVCLTGEKPRDAEFVVAEDDVCGTCMVQVGVEHTGWSASACGRVELDRRVLSVWSMGLVHGVVAVAG